TSRTGRGTCSKRSHGVLDERYHRRGRGRTQRSNRVEESGIGPPMVWGTIGAARDLPRLREISSVLIRHGLGDLVRRTGLATVLELTRQILHWGEAGSSRRRASGAPWKSLDRRL